MQELYNSLMRGEPVYKDNMLAEYRPPTALCLRAARTLKQLSDTNDTNLMLIKQLQTREQEWMKSTEVVENEIEKLRAQLNIIIEKGYSIDEVIKNLEKTPTVVEKSQQTVETAAKVVEESTSTTQAESSEHNIFK